MTDQPAGELASANEIPPLKTLLARGVRKKCPQCGQGPLFKRYNIMYDNCSVCGLKYLEDEGALFGYLFLVDRALFIFPLVVMIFFRSYVPNAYWFYVACVVLIFFAIYTVPHRTGVSLALSYHVRRRRERPRPAYVNPKRRRGP
jgi:uncharacterized protein (DUF983 family)